MQLRGQCASRQVENAKAEMAKPINGTKWYSNFEDLKKSWHFVGQENDVSHRYV
jgi:hypothetical protein